MDSEHIHEVRGLRVHSFSSGHGAPLVFLHGWSQHAGSSYQLRHLLAQHFHVYTPSHIGSGKSSALPTRAIQLHDIAEVYLAWLDRLRLEQCTLVGHSLGGAIAQVLAARAPAGAIRKLILIDSLGVRFTRTRLQWAKEWLAKEARNMFDAPQHHVRALVVPFLMHALARPRDLTALSRLATQLDVQAESRTIAVPTTVIWGTNDSFIPQSIGEQLARIIPAATFSLVNGGHDWPLLQPKALLRFLQ